MNIKNLLEHNKSYADSVATNEFYFLDTSRSANKNRFTRKNVTHRQDGAMIYGNMNKEAGSSQATGLVKKKRSKISDFFSKLNSALLKVSLGFRCFI